MGQIMVTVKSNEDDLVDFSDIMQQVTTDSSRIPFSAVDARGLFTDGIQLHRTPFVLPSELQRFLRGYGLLVKMPLPCRGGQAMFVRLDQGYHQLADVLDTMELAMAGMREL